MKTFEYKNHQVIIQKKKGTTNSRIVTILTLPDKRQVTEFEGDYTIKKASNRAKDYIGF